MKKKVKTPCIPALKDRVFRRHWIKVLFSKTTLFSRAFAMVLSSVLILNAKESSVAVQERNGVPNISTRRNPDSRGFHVFADLLIWIANEAGPDCWAEVIRSDSNTSTNDLRQVYFRWDPGFRVGIGYRMQYDEWDTQTYFTRFYTCGKDSVSSEPGTVFSTYLGNFYVGNPNGSGIHGPSYQKARIEWTVNFNMFDWELGRSFWVSKSLALRPFLAAKGGWIHQSLHSTWQNPDVSGLSDPLPFNIGTEKIKNHFWGIGPAAGINMKWNLFAKQWEFYLFGDFSGALMWGRWSFHDLFENDIHHQVSVHLQNLHSGASMIRTLMGLGWNFNRNWFLFSIKFGYELQFWLDQLQFYSFTAGRQTNALTLQGGTFAFCFDY